MVRGGRAFEAGERQALADSLRAETLGCIHCAPKKQARRAQLIGMGASTPSRARRDRRGGNVWSCRSRRSCFRIGFALRSLSNACRSGRSVWRVQADSLRAETLGCKDVGGRSYALRTAE